MWNDSCHIYLQLNDGSNDLIMKRDSVIWIQQHIIFEIKLTSISISGYIANFGKSNLI
mgnify:CR=1 FL=1